MEVLNTLFNIMSTIGGMIEGFINILAWLVLVAAGAFIIQYFGKALWQSYHKWKDKQEIRNEMLMQQRYRNLYQEVLAEDVDQLAEAAAKEMRRQYRRSTR